MNIKQSKVMEITLQQKNEEIAKMLGFIAKTYCSTKDELNANAIWCDPNHGLPVGELQFDTDWNWLMEAIKFINSTYKQNVVGRDLSYTMRFLSSGGYWNGSEIKQPGLHFNSIEEVFDAVYRYAKTWNGRKVYKISQEDAK